MKGGWYIDTKKKGKENVKKRKICGDEITKKEFKCGG